MSSFRGEQMLGSFLFFGVDTWDNHNMCGCHPHIPLGNLASEIGNYIAFYIPLRIVLVLLLY